MTNSKEEKKWRPLKELAPFTPYKVGYLSLMARRNNLKVRKVKGTWYSSLEEVKAFELLMRKRKEERKRQLSHSYRVKSGKGPVDSSAERKAGLKVSVKSDTIFNEVQRELKDVLSEIREKERAIKKDYMTYKKKSEKYPFRVEEDPEKKVRALEKEEELAEKLIIDLGKLLNTAHQVHEGVDEIEQEDHEKIKKEVVSIPIKNKGKIVSGGDLSEVLGKGKEVVFSNRDDFDSAQASESLPFDDSGKCKRENSVLLAIALTLFLMALAMAVFVALM